jgi:hypothetical protein
MKLENQVCSLELAKRLKELGFEQESLFYHVKEYYLNAKAITQTKYSNTHSEEVSAYTVAELGEMLPVNYYSLKAYNGEWCCYKIEDELNKEDFLFLTTISNTEADARAKMLIYLKENNLV